MKILHVVNDANTGGAQTLIEALAVSSSPLDEVHIFVIMNRGSLSKRLESVASSVSYANVSKRSKNLFRPVRLLRELITSREIDLVHSHLLQSDLVCLMAAPKVPVISTLHTSGGHESNALSRAVSRVVALISGRFGAVVACSPSAKAYAQRMNYSNASRIEIIFNGSKIPDSIETHAKPPAFICLSRWHPMKDHLTLLKAFKIFVRTRPNWRLICAGNGVDTNNSELVRMIDAEGLHDLVDLRGAVSDVVSLFEQGSALVISSSHGEALPMAGIEALAYGLPVITTDVGDCASLAVRPEFVVNPGSPLELSASLESIACLDHRGYEAIQTLSWRAADSSFNSVNVAIQYSSVYASLTSKQR